MSMTWQVMLSFLKSRAGRRARSGISSPAVSMRIATGNVCGRRYVCSSRSAAFTSIMGNLPARRLRGGLQLVKGRRPLPLQWRAMARYRIVQWRDLPSLVEAVDGEQTVRVPLSPRFQDLIDAVAMREGATDSEAYLDGWAAGPEAERPGDAEAVARAVAAELEEGFQDLVVRRMLGPPPG
jgi:hypothetical protein